MVLGERLLTIALQLILVLLFRGVVLKREQGSVGHLPGRLKRQNEVLRSLLLDSQVAGLQREVVLLLVKLGNDLPLLARVVDDGDLLVAGQPGRYAELELRLDLLGDGREFVLVKADVSSVQRLEDHVACERCGLRWIAGQHELVLRRLGVPVLGGLALFRSSRLRDLVNVLLDLRLVMEDDRARPSEEGIGDLNLELLRFVASRQDILLARCIRASICDIE